MNKEEYLKKLAKLVKKLPKEDREDILSDYEEHFRIGVENGRSEEEIAEALGDPKTIAKQIKAEYLIKEAEDKPSVSGIIKATLATLAAAGLGIFNLILAVPALGAAAFTVGLLYIGGFTAIFSGIFVIVSPLIKLLFPSPYMHVPGDGGINLITLAIIISGIGLTVLGVKWVKTTNKLAKWFYKVIIKYLKSNLNVIKEQTEVFK